jgi:hypothetical protein
MVLTRAKWDIVTVLRRPAEHGPLPDLIERHRPFLDAVEDSRPSDLSDDRWAAAMRGLRAFLAGGHGPKAEGAGWPPGELYAVPQLWSQIHLTGAALLIGDREVVEITAAAIRIKSASGSISAFYRQPTVD